MSSISLVLIVGLTSLGAYLAAMQFAGLRRGDLRGAVMETLECLGLVVIFFLANFAVGTALILGLRALTGRFISVSLLSKLAVRAGEPPWGMVRSRPPSFDTINRQEGPP